MVKGVQRVNPPAAISGGEIAIELTGVDGGAAANLRVFVDEVEAHVVAASNRRALAVVPQLDHGGTVNVSIDGDDAALSAGLTVAKKLAGDLHPVANPAYDPADGSLYVTRSGSRGEHMMVSLYRIGSDGTIHEYSGEIMNPTAVAFDPRGQMYVSSRFDGTVYRVSALKEVSVFASDLGIATGLAFNAAGELFVGDRSGTIFRVNEIGEATPWAEHEPSVSAYHLAFGPDGALYVTGPTISTYDVITRFDKHGAARTFFRGLGRPQGMAFDRAGNLYVAASLRGRRGIVRISPDGTRAELVVAGSNVIGLAFGFDGNMAVVTIDSVYELEMGVAGVLLD